MKWLWLWTMACSPLEVGTWHDISPRNYGKNVSRYIKWSFLTCGKKYVPTWHEMMKYWLVVWNISYFSIIYGIILPIDFHIFARWLLHHQPVVNISRSKKIVHYTPAEVTLLHETCARWVYTKKDGTPKISKVPQKSCLTMVYGRYSITNYMVNDG